MFQDLPPPPAVEQPAEDYEEVLPILLMLEPGPAQIVITASREPIYASSSSKSTTVISSETIEKLGPTRSVDILRLTPSLAVAETGPAGTQAQIRIRGAEANHSLLFIEGIKANDPAAGNEARFELIGEGSYDFIEIVRGPQSSLWGSEAIGGLITSRSHDRYTHGTRLATKAEAGSFGTLSGLAKLELGDRRTGLTMTLAGQRSDGIDSFGSDGEKDGYRNLSARFSGSVELSDHIQLETSGFAIDANSEFDGFDPFTFQRADTQDESDQRIGAIRAGLSIDPSHDWGFWIGGSALGSSNINLLDDTETNRTSAERYTALGMASHHFELFGASQSLNLAIDHEREDFRADDIAFGGFTRQDQHRDRSGAALEWRIDLPRDANVQLALRHDDFSDFADATSFSAGLMVPLADNLDLTANYGEGIAQPSFYDLYGFFPGSFVGNPALKPESSKGYDIGLRFDVDDFYGSLVWFEQDLDDEIVDIFDPTTFLSTTANGEGKSRRRGLELVAGYGSSRLPFDLSFNYSYLDAEGPQAPDGSRLRETRRPKHRAALHLTGKSGDLDYGASLAIVGARFDDDFDRFPAERVKLDAYALASARIGYELNDKIELSLRGTNLFDADYQDVVGYETQGRAIFLGISLAP
ncbi:TonB-dependent receptor plug domain-containing protein [Sphingomicrobium flavum]|uniref:TonB-dependent receptor plug domain-containing protein n=1 Tax=Sphingomicrobium flavum TaxID=1229164 RepID=UPI0021ADC1F8|nr:TonB-dependent receptor [Sphingomicrobium flavum]